MSKINTMLEVALTQAAKGCHVTPVSPITKAPTLKNWTTEASNDCEKIATWWKQNPNAMVGIATGSKSNIFVIDCDEGLDKEGNPKNGIANFERVLEKLSMDVSNTFQVRTPSTGKHYYFSVKNGVVLRNSNSLIADKVDTRGEGGMIVAAGSVRADGKIYEALNDNPMQPIPEKLVEYIQQLGKKEKAIELKGIWKSEIPEGRRNSTLLSISGSLRRYGADEGLIYLVLQGINQQCCKPPMPDSDIASIANSVSKYNQSYTDTSTGNAERFRDQNKGKVMYSAELNSWLIWNGKVWQLDKTLAVNELAKEIGYLLKLEAESMKEEADYE